MEWSAGGREDNFFLGRREGGRKEGKEPEGEKGRCGSGEGIKLDSNVLIKINFNFSRGREV